MLACHLNVLAHCSSETLDAANHLELTLTQKRRNPSELQGFSHAHFALVLEKLLVPAGIPNSVDQTGNGLEEYADATSPDLTAQHLQPC